MRLSITQWLKVLPLNRVISFILYSFISIFVTSIACVRINYSVEFILIGLVNLIAFLMFNPFGIIAIFIVYLTLGLPRSYLKVYLSWIFLIGVVVTLWIGSLPSPDSIGEIFFMSLLLFYGVLILLCILYRLFAELRKTRAGNSMPTTYRPPKRLIQLTSFAYGLASAYFAWQLSEKSFQGYRPAWFPHALLLFATVAIGVICLIIYQWLKRSHFFLTGMGCFSAIFLGVSLFTPSMVITSAKNVAGDAPFCLQVVTNRGYQPVTSRLDMSMIRMRTTGSGYHAVLVVEQAGETQLFNWSYAQNAFVGASLSYVRSIHCKPKKQYLLGLPFFHGEQSKIAYIRMGDMAYSIPHEYQPMVLFDALAFSSQAPDFLPIKRRQTSRTDWFSWSVSIKATDDWLHLSEPSEEDKIIELGSNEDGLMLRSYKTKIEAHEFSIITSKKVILTH